ncbi:unnamed protein product [Owenia fusiformis]|uniref:Beta-lactamase-related domain-containing protein n=1 Tax=Owenia fusiformis TaxID=6347 RepID=A0A8S4PG04_OWEFU|nr:unnamed protein product [Owenia fusiformis]
MRFWAYRTLLLTTWTAMVIKPQVMAQLDPQKLAAIEEFLTETMACRNIPGLQIALVTSEEVLMAKGYGLSNIEKKTPMTERTVTSIQSISKGMLSTLVAAVLSDLNQSGLDFDTRLQAIMGEDFNTSDPLVTEYASLKDFLAMKSGCNFPEVLVESFQVMSPDEFTRNLKHYKCQWRFRTGMHYSTTGYLVVSKALEKLTGKSFDQLMKEYIFNPLGMTDSDIVSKATEIYGFSHAYTTGSDDISDVEVTPAFISQSGYMMGGAGVAFNANDMANQSGHMMGGAGVASNANDMAKYLQMHLNNGKNQDGQQIIDESNLRITKENWNVYKYKPYSLPRPTFPEGLVSGAYGFGWIKGYQKGYAMLHHPGNYAYYRTHVVIWPDLDLALFLHTNGRQFIDQIDATFANFIYILDVLNGDVPWLNTTTRCSFPEPWRTAVKALPESIPTDLDPALSLEKYVGYYGQPGYGCFQVTLINAVLEMTYGKTGEFELHATGNGHEFWRKGKGLQAWRWSKQDWYFAESPYPRTCEFFVDSGNVTGASCKFDFNYEGYEKINGEKPEIEALCSEYTTGIPSESRTPLPTPELLLPTWAIVVITVAVGLVVAAIFGCIIYRGRKMKRKEAKDTLPDSNAYLYGRQNTELSDAADDKNIVPMDYETAVGEINPGATVERHLDAMNDLNESTGDTDSAGGPRSTTVRVEYQPDANPSQL